MSNNLICAIDPGTGGGFAWGEGSQMQTMNMPKRKVIKDGEVQVTKKGKAKFEVDEDAILVFLAKKKQQHPDVEIIIEHQQLRMSDSVGFKMFRMQMLLNNYNTILSFCKALEIQVEVIQAKRWQKKHKPLPRDYVKKKAALLKIAKMKYPRLRPTAATCDSVLILEYALVMKSYE